MKKRRLLLADYDTAAHGLWTLCALKVTKAPQVQTLVNVPGRYAPLDQSDYLTDGQPYYGNATLNASLESSEGSHSERQARIDAMRDHLDGRSIRIVHPDHPDHYMIGRVQIQQEYNDLAHCCVSITAVCDPWFYRTEETVVELTATDAEQTVDLLNSGRLAVVPTVIVTGSVKMSYNSNIWNLENAQYFLPDLCLLPGSAYGQPGVHSVTYSGAGTVEIRYREAVLAG